MNQTFINTSLDVRTLNGPGAGHDFGLLEPLVYVMRNGRSVRAPTDSQTDGISTPRFIWSVIPPFGRTWFPGIIHDAAYRDTLEISTDCGRWIPAHFDQEQADDLMAEMLAAQGVDDVELGVIVDALRNVGGLAFAEDRRAKAA